jgi:hypothetical protein
MAFSVLTQHLLGTRPLLRGEFGMSHHRNEHRLGLTPNVLFSLKCISFLHGCASVSKGYEARLRESVFTVGPRLV